MNSITIPLYSNSTSYSYTTNVYKLIDCSEIILNLNGIYSGAIPIYLKIDWGDGTIQLFDNDIYQNLNIYNSPIIYNKILNDTYSHVCYPSSTALYKSFNIQVLIMYNDSNYTIITVPIRVRTYDFFETIYDVDLVNVNILPTPTNTKEFQLMSKKDNSIIEFRS